MAASDRSNKRHTMSYTDKGLASTVYTAFAAQQPSASSNFGAHTAPAARQLSASSDSAAHVAPAVRQPSALAYTTATAASLSRNPSTCASASGMGLPLPRKNTGSIIAVIAPQPSDDSADTVSFTPWTTVVRKPRNDQHQPELRNSDESYLKLHVSKLKHRKSYVEGANKIYEIASSVYVFLCCHQWGYATLCCALGKVNEEDSLLYPVR